MQEDISWTLIIVSLFFGLFIIYRTASRNARLKVKVDHEDTDYVPPSKPEPCPTLMSLEDLAKFNGVDNNDSIYISILGRIYDVTSNKTGKEFYGPGGPYHIFAGKDATRALAEMEISQEYCNVPLSSFLNNLTLQQKETLFDWQKRFESKYSTVGKVKFNKPEDNKIANRNYVTLEKSCDTNSPYWGDLADENNTFYS